MLTRRDVTHYESRNYAAEIRATVDGDEARLEGHAAVFGVPSVDLDGFREIIDPGAFDEALEAGDDARALWNHDSNAVMARVHSGTLKLGKDETGLTVDFGVEADPWRREISQIERRDVDQMSFGFRLRGPDRDASQDWAVVDGKLIRTVLAVELFDVSPVAFPAYPQTDIAARSAFSFLAGRAAEELEEGDVLVGILEELVARMEERSIEGRSEFSPAQLEEIKARLRERQDPAEPGPVSHRGAYFIRLQELADRELGIEA